MVGAGIFLLGHDAGHGALFNSKKINNAVGFTLHTLLLVPYFAWRSTHHGHHKATASVERDENYVPYTRKDFNLPDAKKARKSDYADVFEETPIFTFGRMLIMQGIGLWLYLTFNVMGAKMYPPGTSHWIPTSPLFKPSQRKYIFYSDIAVISMALFLIALGPRIILKYYLVPYLLMTHW